MRFESKRQRANLDKRCHFCTDQLVFTNAADVLTLSFTNAFAYIEPKVRAPTSHNAAPLARDSRR
jgi:hypothetical protein